MLRKAKTPAHAQANLAGEGLVLFFLLQWALSSLVALTIGATAGAPAALHAAFRLAGTLLLLALPYRYLCVKGKAFTLRVPLAKGTLPFAALLPLFLLLVVLLNVAASLARGGFNVAAGTPTQLPQGAAAILLYALSSCAVTPVFEELLFRGAVQGLLRPHGAWVAIAATSVLFTLLHAAGWDIFTVLVLALALGYVREATGSVLPCICLHVANNLVAFGNLLLQRFAPALVWQYTLALLALALVGSVAGAWVLHRQKQRLPLPKADAPFFAGLRAVWRAPRLAMALFMAAALFLARGVLSLSN